MSPASRPPLSPPVAPPPERWLFVDNVRALLAASEPEHPIRSDGWIREHVAPGRARRLAHRWALPASVFAAWQRERAHAAAERAPTDAQIADFIAYTHRRSIPMWSMTGALTQHGRLVHGLIQENLRAAAVRARTEANASSRGAPAAPACVSSTEDRPMSTTPPAPPPLPSDRLLLVRDVRAFFPTREDGRCAVSDRWIKQHVAPRQAMRVGRRWAIRESHALAWLARYTAGTLEETDQPMRRRQRPHGNVAGLRDPDIS